MRVRHEGKPFLCVLISVWSYLSEWHNISLPCQVLCKITLHFLCDSFSNFVNCVISPFQGQRFEDVLAQKYFGGSLIFVEIWFHLASLGRLDVIIWLKCWFWDDQCLQIKSKHDNPSNPPESSHRETLKTHRAGTKLITLSALNCLCEAQNLQSTVKDTSCASGWAESVEGFPSNQRHTPSIWTQKFNLRGLWCVGRKRGSGWQPSNFLVNQCQCHKLKLFGAARPQNSELSFVNVSALIPSYCRFSNCSKAFRFWLANAKFSQNRAVYAMDADSRRLWSHQRVSGAQNSFVLLFNCEPSPQSEIVAICENLAGGGEFSLAKWNKERVTLFQADDCLCRDHLHGRKTRSERLTRSFCGPDNPSLLHGETERCMFLATKQHGLHHTQTFFFWEIRPKKHTKETQNPGRINYRCQSLKRSGCKKEDALKRTYTLPSLLYLTERETRVGRPRNAFELNWEIWLFRWPCLFGRVGFWILSGNPRGIIVKHLSLAEILLNEAWSASTDPGSKSRRFRIVNIEITYLFADGRVCVRQEKILVLPTFQQVNTEAIWLTLSNSMKWKMEITPVSDVLSSCNCVNQASSSEDRVDMWFSTPRMSPSQLDFIQSRNFWTPSSGPTWWLQSCFFCKNTD